MMRSRNICPAVRFLLLALLLMVLPAPSMAADPSSLLPVPSPEAAELAGKLAASLDRRANPETGLCPSFYGDEGSVGRNGAQIYDTGLRILADSRYSSRIIRTFTAQNPAAPSPERPQTLAGQFSPATGIFSWIRIKGFEEPGWWHTWEWSVKTGENAWLGKGSLYHYRLSADPAALRLAVERADFILALQDEDGGVRIGPRGLAEDFWWRRKSTENNESALSFLDELFRETGEQRYRQAADRIYEWLASVYDHELHLFSRGEVESDGRWQKDGIEDFAADTTNWLPIERILQDARFGANRRERLAEIERMMAATLRHAGVMDKDSLAGLSYSPRSKKSSVVSLEWSSQYALLCLRMSAEYRKEGDAARAGDFHRQYLSLVQRLLGYLQEVDKEKTAAHAVYPDGRLAAGEPMWDDTARTPRAYLSAASHLYVGFAVRGIDPLRLDD